MTDQSDVPAAGTSRLGIDLAASSAMPLSVNIVITSSSSTSAGIDADSAVTATVRVYGDGGTSTSTPRRSRRPQAVPHAVPYSMSDSDMLAWVTGRSIRNKELFVPFADED
jgi:hypothetical protein